MITSMTGVGKAIVRYADKNVNIFIKTLNSKQLDISTRIPNAYREKDLEIRSLLSEQLGRGKVELTIAIDEGQSALSSVQRINPEALAYYVRAFAEVKVQYLEREFAQFNNMESILRLPGVLMSSENNLPEVSEEEWHEVREGICLALQEVLAFRKQEGVMLEEVLRKRIERIEELLNEISIPEAERIQNIRKRLEETLQKLSFDSYDKGRLEQEMIYYIEKLDVNEEKDRLKHHLSYFVTELEKEEGQQGKTLGFIAQEIGREINTLGSKSNHAEMQQIVVKMKDELEQIKEQILNVL